MTEVEYEGDARRTTDPQQSTNSGRLRGARINRKRQGRRGKRKSRSAGQLPAALYATLQSEP
jgi:hypothetical protein